MRDVKQIIIHCSASNFGNCKLINEWHIKRGWDEVGYNYIIPNGYSTNKAYENKKEDILDGEIEIGRDLEKIPAHVYRHNRDSIGICLIGYDEDDFTNPQLISLSTLCIKLMKDYNLTTKDIFCHYQYDNSKSCPGMEIEKIRRMVELS